MNTFDELLLCRLFYEHFMLVILLIIVMLVTLLIIKYCYVGYFMK